VTGSRSPIPVARARALAQLADVAEQARDDAAAARAPNTLRGYRADWRDFAGWCETHRLAALPAAPETVALYLSALAGRRTTATLQRRLSAIARAHKAAGHPSPTTDATVRTVWSGIRRTHGTAQEGKTPLVTAELRRVVDRLGERPIAVRDRALLLLGFAAALRRAELVALDVDDVQATAAGLVVRVRRSKTAQEGAGRTVGVPCGSHPETCPLRAVQRWLAVRRNPAPAFFCWIDRHGHQHPGQLSDRAVALVVKRHARAAGLDAASYAGHSLRAGFATAAAEADVPERVIALQTGHKSMVVLRRYIRSGSLFRDNAAARVGL
jgi:site-specific recombinase XerD